MNLVKERIIVIKTFITTLAGRQGPTGMSRVQAAPFSGSVTIVTTPPWALTTLRAMGRLSPVHPDDDALAVLERMEQEEITELPVVWEGKLLGVIERDSLLQLMHLRSERRA